MTTFVLKIYISIDEPRLELWPLSSTCWPQADEYIMNEILVSVT